LIYDLPGLEAESHVNSQQLPENYELQFIGNDLEGGFYYYNLKAGSFIRIKNAFA
jgi:hypothetical protein